MPLPHTIETSQLGTATLRSTMMHETDFSEANTATDR